MGLQADLDAVEKMLKDILDNTDMSADEMRGRVLHAWGKVRNINASTTVLTSSRTIRGVSSTTGQPFSYQLANKDGEG